jgi:foldase protein PrsA
LISTLAFVLLFGACSSGNPEVGTVGETKIRLSDIEKLYVGNTVPIDAAFRDTLFKLLAVEALDQGLTADFGVSVDQAAVETLFGEMKAEMETAQQTPAQFVGVTGASEEMIHFNARISVLAQTVIDELLSQEDIVQRVLADPLLSNQVCAKHILVATEAEANDVVTRLKAGEDFATLATEVSTDTQTPGGDLGCAPAAGYVVSFAEAAVAAKINEITGPVQSEYGFHVIIVTQRTTATRETYLADPRSWLPDNEISSIWADWFNNILQAATVELDPQYGTWSPVGIVAPGATTTTTTTVPPTPTTGADGLTTTTVPATTSTTAPAGSTTTTPSGG